MTSFKMSLWNTGWSRHTCKSIYHYCWRHSGCIPFEISILEKVDGKRRSFLEWKNWYLFHWSTENESWQELLHWSVDDFFTAWMSSTLSGQWLEVDDAPSHGAKVTQQFLRQNTPDFIAADEWVSYSPDLIPLDYCIWDILQDLVYEGLGLPFANLQDLKQDIPFHSRCKTVKHSCQSATVHQKQVEVTTEIVRKSIA